MTVSYRVTEESLPRLTGLELRVGLDGCTRSDITIFAGIKRVFGVCGTIFVGIGLGFLISWLFRKPAPPQTSPSVDSGSTLPGGP